MSETPIVLLSAAPANVERLRSSLEEARYRITAVETVDAAIAALGTQSVLVVAGMADDVSATTCRRVRETPALRGLGICVITDSEEADVRVDLLRAGADEVLLDGVDPRELDARIQALLLRSTRAAAGITLAAETAAARRPRRSIAVFSPSGGVGTTTIAVNVALALGARQPGRVAIADMHLPFGQVATHLDIRPRRTITDLASDEGALVDPSLLPTFAERHASGLSIYAAPGTWDPTAIMTPEMAVVFIETATLAHDRLVLDLGSAVDERTLSALARADVALLPVRPDIAALRALRSFADALAERQIDLGRTAFVVNDIAGRESLRPRDVETVLGRSPVAELPNDPLAFVRAVNEGIPVVISAPESAGAVALMRLASIAIGDAGSAPEAGRPASPTEKKSSGRFGGLFGNRS